MRHLSGKVIERHCLQQNRQISLILTVRIVTAAHDAAIAFNMIVKVVVTMTTTMMIMMTTMRMTI